MSKSISNGRDDNERGPDGRFQKGWKGGPGNPRVRRLSEYQRAVTDSVSPDALRLVLERILDKALRGDLAAAKIIVDRTLGRVPAPRTENGCESVDLPELSTSSDTLRAMSAILHAVAVGKLSPSDAARLTGVIEVARRVIETNDFSSRIAALEGVR